MSTTMAASTAFEGTERRTADQIVAGYFQKAVHRASTNALAIEHAGARYPVADCGAVANAAHAPIAGWRICTTCWPAGLPIAPEPPRLDVLPTTLPDCLNWRTPVAATVQPVALVAPARAPRATGWFELTA